MILIRITIDRKIYVSYNRERMNQNGIKRFYGYETVAEVTG